MEDTGILPKATTIDGRLRALKDFKERNKKIKEQIHKDFKNENLARAKYYQGLIKGYRKINIKPTHILDNKTMQWIKIED